VGMLIWNKLGFLSEGVILVLCL